MVKAKKRGKTEAEKKAETNRYGVLGFICAVTGLIIFPIIFGIAAIMFGYLNMTRETKNLWKLDIPVGLIDVIFGLLFISGALTV
jgi:hypothetical protein